MSVKLVPLIVALSIFSEKVASTLELAATFVAPSDGETLVTVGAVVSASTFKLKLALPTESTGPLVLFHEMA